jgi:hypothetical protein
MQAARVAAPNLRGRKLFFSGFHILPLVGFSVPRRVLTNDRTSAESPHYLGSGRDGDAAGGIAVLVRLSFVSALKLFHGVSTL